MLRYRPTQYLSCSPGDLQLLEQSVAGGVLLARNAGMPLIGWQDGRWQGDLFLGRQEG